MRRLRPGRRRATVGGAMRISHVTYGTALAIMIGWLLWVGKPVLLPVIAALISVYVLSAAADSMGKVPLLGRLPSWVRRTLALIGFAVF